MTGWGVIGRRRAWHRLRRATRRSIARSASLAGVIALAACTVGPNYKPPGAAALKVPDRFVADTGGTPVTRDELARYWQQFDDPALDWLVDQALANNLDIAVAAARVREARATLNVARASLFPTLDASGSVTHTIQRNGSSTIVTTTPAAGTGTGTTGGTGTGIGTGIGTGTGTTTVVTGTGASTNLNAGFDAAYEVDLFGGVRRSIQASRADQQSSEASLHNAQLTVVSEVALDYIDAREAQARLAIARANLASQDDTLQIIGWRVQAGLASALDLEQERALRAQTAASIPSLQTSYVQSVNALALLIGQAPGAVEPVLDPVRPIPLPTRLIDADVPIDVIRRRPDVVAAERTLAAETARIGVATADLYPALRLSGSIGGNGAGIGDITKYLAGSVVGAISAPIFEGGAIRARIAGQRATTDAALATYRSSVLTALQDVENAMTSLVNSRDAEAQLLIAVEAARNSATYAREQYQAGLIDFQSLLETERTLLSSQDSAASARGDRATALIQLYKALGGGWQAAPTPAPLTATADATPSAATRP